MGDAESKLIINHLSLIDKPKKQQRKQLIPPADSAIKKTPY
jgi:hypothetical protein